MQIKAELTITGVKQFKGDVEGNSYDHTKVLGLMPFPSNRKESNLGYNVMEMPYGDSRNFTKFDGRDFPLTVEAELVPSTAGYEVISVKFPTPKS